nr:DUF4250 domain-containing protein [uncultured Gemmiger sp.]
MLPRDPVILFSYVNTQLRDRGIDLDDFCAEENVDRAVLCQTLREVGFEYDPKANRFV